MTGFEELVRGFGQGPERNHHERRELSGTPACESLRDVPTDRGRRVAKVVAESEVVPSWWPVKKRNRLPSNVICKLPGPEFLVGMCSHALVNARSVPVQRAPNDER